MIFFLLFAQNYDKTQLTESGGKNMIGFKESGDTEFTDQNLLAARLGLGRMLRRQQKNGLSKLSS